MSSWSSLLLIGFLKQLNLKIGNSRFIRSYFGHTKKGFLSFLVGLKSVVCLCGIFSLEDGF